MNILFVTTEAVPFCKTGGLGDVCGSLPGELERLGHRVAIVLPAFRQVLDAGIPIEPTSITLEVPIGCKLVTGGLLKSQLPGTGVPVYLVTQDEYYDRRELYGEEGQDYKDNCERFVFFCRAALEAITALKLETELVHAHDWPAGLVPAYLKTELAGVPPYDEMASLLTIHNLAYQGNFWHWDMELTGIDWKYFNWKEMEFHGSLSFLKSGLAFADALTTVSPQYAQEIQLPPLSCGMEGILKHRRHDLFGIINGVDYSVWNPATDPHLGPHTYDVDTFAVGKAACKAALQQEVGLPVKPDAPMLASVGRLVDQKGFDLVAGIIPHWAETSDAQWVILGTGDPKYHALLTDLAARYPDKLAVRLEFSNELAHRIEAGADMFLMPSRYEPCGLNQLYSLKYGTVPIVRATGGLADTVVDLNDHTQADGTANGFSFSVYSDEALDATVQRACAAYADSPRWEQLIRTGMKQDWSWESSARQYSDLYQRVRAARHSVV